MTKRRKLFIKVHWHWSARDGTEKRSCFPCIPFLQL